MRRTVVFLIVLGIQVSMLVFIVTRALTLENLAFTCHTEIISPNAKVGPIRQVMPLNGIEQSLGGSARLVVTGSGGEFVSEPAPSLFERFIFGNPRRVTLKLKGTFDGSKLVSGSESFVTECELERR